MIPELTMRFSDDMIVLEKWKPNKPISLIYFDGDKERFYVKRFLIEREDKIENVISEHPKSYLELVSTDWRPMVEIEYPKPRGKDPKPNLQIDIEGFIAVKGIKAQGNQLTSEKVKNINTLEPLPYEEPIVHDTRDIEVVDEEDVIPSKAQKTKKTTSKSSATEDSSEPSSIDEEGQTSLF